MGHHVPSNFLPEGFQCASLLGSSEYDEIWAEAEQKTALLLGKIQPCRPSEECRRAVVNYVERLIERELKCKVFSFGSVPLKTYLPDGDIDLTAIISENHCLNGTWAKRVCTILEHEECNQKSEFHVKEVKCIFAEVPVVKCLVENIIVDITFNQLGGLSTLCFLEEVDRLIGREHLFKRSIVLVKAWCFYESRILGAHHGLLSTYALEVLVLYIFHVFHHSLRGPLEVLFRFLQFFSKFEWEQYCLSLWGIVPLDSMIVEPAQSFNGDFLLSEDYLKSCREKYSILFENNQGKTFSQKFMNLVDPLRPFNNLGRSVNSGNLVRIYSAFSYGATQLEKLLLSPKEYVSKNLALFFRNTQKHCLGHRPDAGVGASLGVVSKCNGELKGEVNLDAISFSEDHVDQEHSNCTSEACLDKHAHANIDSCSSHVDNEGARLGEVALVLHRKDDSMHTHAYVSPKWLFDETNDPCKQDVLSIRSHKGVEDADSIENSSCHHSFSNEMREDSPLDEDLSYSSTTIATPTVLSVCFSDRGAYDPGEQAFCKEQFNEEDVQNAETQARKDLMSRVQGSEIRVTDASILEGDYLTYFQNLEAGRFYQSYHSRGNSSYAFNNARAKHIIRGSAWEGPGIAMLPDYFAYTSSSRHRLPQMPIHDNNARGPNGLLAEGFPKLQKGTGTFFPNLKTNLDRDKRALPNGIRCQRTLGGMESFNSVGYNSSEAPRARSHAPKKRDWSNKLRSRRSNDTKIGEQHWDPPTEDVGLGNVLSMDTLDCFSHSFEGQINGCHFGDERNDTMDWSRRSLDSAVVLSSGNNKVLPLEKLEFGSFGPGFLAKGLQKVPAHVNNAELLPQAQHSTPCDKHSEPREAVLKAGAHIDWPQSVQKVYELKEEDFPPLSFGQRELPNAFAAEKAMSPTRGVSNHQTCLLGHVSYVTKIAQN